MSCTSLELAKEVMQESSMIIYIFFWMSWFRNRWSCQEWVDEGEASTSHWWRLCQIFLHPRDIGEGFSKYENEIVGIHCNLFSFTSTYSFRLFFLQWNSIICCTSTILKEIQKILNFTAKNKKKNHLHLHTCILCIYPTDLQLNWTCK